jgi:hypothetical protein
VKRGFLRLLVFDQGFYSIEHALINDRRLERAIIFNSFVEFDAYVTHGGDSRPRSFIVAVVAAHRPNARNSMAPNLKTAVLIQMITAAFFSEMLGGCFIFR